MPGFIKLIDFRNGSETLRDRALNGPQCPEAVMYNDETVGMLVSMEHVMEFLSSKRGSLSGLDIKPFTAKNFYETTRSALAIGAPSPLGDITIIAFRQNKKGVGTALALISGEFWANHPGTFKPASWHNAQSRTPRDAKNHTNVDIAQDFTQPWRTLQSEIGTIAATAAEGAIVYRRDGEIAGLHPDIALKLKEHIFNGRAEIIQDWRAIDFKQNLHEACQSVIERRNFVRISGAEHPGSHDTKHLCTLVDGLSSEFLVLESGKVREVDARIKIPYCFDFNATICTDFETATKIRINVDSPSQWKLLKKAFQQAHLRDENITLQNEVELHFAKKTLQTQDLRKTSNFAFNTTGQVEFCLKATGELKHLRFTFNDQPGLSTMAALCPQHTEFHSGSSHSQHQAFLMERA